MNRSKMKRNRIYLCLAHMSGNEMKFVQDAFDTNWVVPLGPNVNGFEEDLEEFVGQRGGGTLRWYCSRTPISHRLWCECWR